MNPLAQKKVLIFGLLGGFGCLAGWLLGEAFLAAALPSRKADAAAASLVSRPDASKLVRSAPAPETPQIDARKSAPPLPAEFKKRVDQAGGKTGQIQITLIWFNRNDLDLHCIDPYGEEIDFRHKKAERSQGHLDIDRNVDGETTEPVENIYFPEGFTPLGRYRVYVDYYGNHGSADPTEFKVNYAVDDRRKEISGEIRPGERKRLIAEIALPGLRMAVPPEIVVFPGFKNKLPVRFERDSRNTDPITLKFRDETGGLALPAEVVIPGDRNDVEIDLSAETLAPAGTRNLRVIGIGKYGSVEAETKVAVKAVPSASLIAVPAQVSVPAGGRNRMTVRVAREFFPGLATIRAISLPDGVRMSEASLPEGQDEAKIEITALADAGEGEAIIVALGGPSGVEAGVSLKITRTASAWSWLMVLVIGGWTALLAAGLSLALVIGQNRYMGRIWLSGKQAWTLLAGGGLAGFVAGGIGQTLFGLMAQAEVLPQIGFLIGWLLLGGLLGRGVGFFIPNLHVWRACAAGVVGGLLGALGFILISRLGDIAGRLVGAGLLGFCIGLMVALVEVAFRKAWLEVRYGLRETIAVNLGPEPVRVGGDGKACTVWARGAAPVAMRYWVRSGKVVCEDVVAGRTEELANGASRKVGNLEVVVRTSAADKDTGPTPVPFEGPEPSSGKPPPENPKELKAKAPPPPQIKAPPRAPQSKAPPPPPHAKLSPPPPASAPESKPAPPPPKPGAGSTATGDSACPLCGRKVVGSPSKRYCMACDHDF